MVNAFQEGMQFAQERTRRENREKGIGALADEFGDQALAPQEFQAVRGTARLDKKFISDEKQQGVENARADVIAANTETDRATAERERAAGALLGVYESGFKNGIDPAQITERFAPVLQKLGVDPASFPDLNASFTEDPEGTIAALKAALRGQRKRGTGVRQRPIRVVNEDGTLSFFQVDEATGEFVDTGLVPAQSVEAGRRLTVAEANVDAKQPGFKGAVKEEEALGAGRGAIRVEDLPTSRTAVAAQQAKLDSGEATAGRAVSALDDAMGEVGTFTAGTAGAILKLIPGTPAFDLVEEILPVVSQEFVANLQNMRDMSKTGGAVGNVSNAEGDKLQALRGSLNTGQSPDQLLKNMQKMKAQILASRALIQEAWVQDQAARAEAVAAGGAAPVPAAAGQRRRFNPETGQLE